MARSSDAKNGEAARAMTPRSSAKRATGRGQAKPVAAAPKARPPETVLESPRPLAARPPTASPDPAAAAPPAPTRVAAPPAGARASAATVAAGPTSSSEAVAPAPARSADGAADATTSPAAKGQPTRTAPVFQPVAAREVGAQRADKPGSAPAPQPEPYALAEPAPAPWVAAAEGTPAPAPARSAPDATALLQAGRTLVEGTIRARRQMVGFTCRQAEHGLALGRAMAGGSLPEVLALQTGYLGRTLDDALAHTLALTRLSSDLVRAGLRSFRPR